MKFIVQTRNSALPDDYPFVVLTRDNWDDFGYRTTFDATLHLSEVEAEVLGNVKIMRRDQKAGPTEMPTGTFERLGEDYASLGASLEYYEVLFKLGPRLFRPILGGLRDVAINDDAKAAVEDLEPFRVSLLRFSGAERTIADATRLLKTKRPIIKRRSVGFKVKFKTSVADDAEAFLVDFDFRRQGRLPNRMNALIGYNGTGKTRLLSNLAIVASGYGYANKVELLRRSAGRFVGTKPAFGRVVVVSYSAFDTFVIPGTTDVEKKRLREEGELFGYVYCGLRKRSENDKPGDVPTYMLKTPAETEREFLTALDRVREAGRQDALLDVMKPLLRDPSFQRIGLAGLYAEGGGEKFGELFRELSSGHKIVLKIVAELTAYISGSEPTLVLIDEPETHLHPPLLAALLKSVRACLESFDGYAVVATHSPVVLQETPAKFAHVLRRMADKNRVVPVSIETFAESIGVITQEVFNLGDGSADWHGTLRLLARNNTIDEIETMFGRPLGFAARSYVLSVMDRDED